MNYLLKLTRHIFILRELLVSSGINDEMEET